MNKSSLRDAILLHLQEELTRQTDAAMLARDEAISEESRAENKWDTHSQEAAYLAEGQARIAAEIRSNIDQYTTLPLPDFSPGDPIALGAVVEVEAAGRHSWYFIGPNSGGLEMKLDGERILVLTPPSPFGRLLIGRHAGDVIPAAGRHTTSDLRIVSVR